MQITATHTHPHPHTLTLTLKTKAYECLEKHDPLPCLIDRTNKYLLDLRLAHWITQKQYEQLRVAQDGVELAHLYYLPKSHKPGTPIRPIISSLKHPTTKISKFLDELLRPLFDRMASCTAVTSGVDVIKQLYQWSKDHLKRETVFCTMDVIDLYTMIPQIEGVLSIKKMLDSLGMNQIGGLRTETIVRLSHFVMQNNYFSYDGQFYHQIRGGAMGSPLTLTMANCYMFFFEKDIVRQVSNSGGLYLQYIDDIFVAINWPTRHFAKQIDRWNEFDSNIKLNVHMDSSVNFLDLHVETTNGKLYTKVYHKPSYEPYYLPFTSVHPLHMKKNIPYAMLIRAIKYCTVFEDYQTEREKLRMALLLNKYPGHFIMKEFDRVFETFNSGHPLTTKNYEELHETMIYSPVKEKVSIDHGKVMFVHFTYCSNMRTFPSIFHDLWQKYFGESPINEIVPVVGTRNVKNLQRQLVRNKP